MCEETALGAEELHKSGVDWEAIAPHDSTYQPGIAEGDVLGCRGGVRIKRTKHTGDWNDWNGANVACSENESTGTPLRQSCR